MDNTESTRLLETGKYEAEEEYRTRSIVWSVLTTLVVAVLVVLVFFENILPDTIAPWIGALPKDPMRAALQIMETAPIIVRVTRSSALF